MDLTALFSAFGLVFVAELGDKTQLAVVAQTCKYRRPWAVFLGASLALALVTALGAASGHLLGRILPQSLLRGGAALAFGVMGVFVVREAVRAGKRVAVEEPSCDPVEGGDGEAASGPALAWDWRAFASTLGLLFVAEMGDKTQLAVLGMAGKSESPWSVFLGGALALVVVTALGVVGGEGLSRVIPQRLLLWISGAAFLAIGALMALGIL